ncbi:P-loop NTPase fold protein [Cupriavidus basilensis]|uniref:P-loop NTPase fold protein n=1 Tax=Cupriavidus basilensis TaxID=68895 RepID=A0ABT6AXG1_9BURK|nr:P-loop NTPase fold protein [Cupriavidus basilensis]MDF3837317.1 P-loop NTPase fold protein [Cupriavidus basilensis]
MTHPFSDDKLKRGAVAEYLTMYLQGKHSTRKERNSQNSFILNINAPWGIGKTYFLNHWAQQLREAGYIVITFDAWKNDFCEQPLVGFMTEIEDQLKGSFDFIGKTRSHAVNLIRKGKRLIKVGTPIVASAVAKKIIGVDSDDLSKIAKSVSEESISAIQKKSTKRTRNSRPP